MSTKDELVAPRYADLPDGGLSEEAQQRLADDLGATSLRYLPVEALARSIGRSPDDMDAVNLAYRDPLGSLVPEWVSPPAREADDRRTSETERRGLWGKR